LLGWKKRLMNAPHRLGHLIAVHKQREVDPARAQRNHMHRNAPERREGLRHRGGAVTQPGANERASHVDTRDIASVAAAALTAFARAEDRDRALAAGFRAHISKPVEPSELVATIASLLADTSV